jgi:hypothetical protein
MDGIKHFLFVDFETHYSKDYSLRFLSVPEYILDERFECQMMAAFDATWRAPKIILPEEIPSFLAQYPPEDTMCCSHNALFDMAILSWRYGWVPGLLQDTLGMCRALRNYKRNSLGEAIKELFGRDSKGDTIGRVIGLSAQGIKQAGLWPEFCTYAMNDVRECAFIYQKLLPEFPAEEMQVMDLVLRAAVEPKLYADVPMLEAHLKDLRERKATLLREAGYEKAALMSTQQFKEALEVLGVEIATKVSDTDRIIPAFAKSDQFMADLLEYDRDFNDDVNYAVQALAAARLSQKSTIEETRAQRFVNIARLPWSRTNGSRRQCAGTAPMLPVPLRYGGAHTHRLSGEWKMNCQNLPRDKTKSKLRKALKAPPGEKLITGDLAQIEARIVAVLCEQGALVQAFRDGEDVYAKFASIVFGRTVTKNDHPAERFIGKTAILGLGYGCGWERFYTMVMTQARQSGIPVQDLFNKDGAARIVNAYRMLFNRIPEAWHRLDGLWNSVVNTPNDRQEETWGPLTFRSRTILLPNTMTLRYTIGEDLWGGHLLENIVQALARIVVMQAAIRLAHKGLRFVLQSHDELVFSVPEAYVKEARAIISEEMIREPHWLPGLPLAVEIGEGDNYGECK